MKKKIIRSHGQARYNTTIIKIKKSLEKGIPFSELADKWTKGNHLVLATFLKKISKMETDK